MISKYHAGWLRAILGRSTEDPVEFAHVSTSLRGAPPEHRRQMNYGPGCEVSRVCFLRKLRESVAPWVSSWRLTWGVSRSPTRRWRCGSGACSRSLSWEPGSSPRSVTRCSGKDAVVQGHDRRCSYHGGTEFRHECQGRTRSIRRADAVLGPPPPAREGRGTGACRCTIGQRSGRRASEAQ